MIILRKNFSLSEVKENWENKLAEKPTGIQALSPARRNSANTTRWKQFNKETGGNRWRLNAGQTRKDFQSWQQQKYGNTI
jgi:hypothetical protein